MPERGRNRGGGGFILNSNSIDDRKDLYLMQRLLEKNDTDSYMADAQRKAVLAFEEQYANDDVENIRVFTQDGRVLIQGRGGKGRVMGRYTAEFAYKHPETLMEAHKQGVSTHNHPGDTHDSIATRVGQTFSAKDIVDAITNNYAATRVRTSNYIFSIQRPVDGWPSSKGINNEITKTYHTAFKKYVFEHTGSRPYIDKNGNLQMTKKIRNLFKEKPELEARLWATATNAGVKAVADKYGLKYRRRKA